MAKRECKKIKVKVNELKLEMVYSNFLLLWNNNYFSICFERGSKWNMYMVHAITNLLACESVIHAHSSVILNINISIWTFSLFWNSCYSNLAFFFYIWFDIINLQRGFTVIRTRRTRDIFLKNWIPRSIPYWHCDLTVLDISSFSWNIR